MVEQVHSGFVSSILFGPAMVNAVRRAIVRRLNVRLMIGSNDCPAAIAFATAPVQDG